MRFVKPAAILVLTLLLASGLEPMPKWSSDRPENLSMIQLLSDPMKYNEKAIVVAGFLRLEFEGNELYLHKEDYEQSLLKNGIWVELEPAVKDEAIRLNMHYVIVRGFFDATARGHMGMTSGTILISKLMPVRPRTND